MRRTVFFSFRTFILIHTHICNLMALFMYMLTNIVENTRKLIQIQIEFVQESTVLINNRIQLDRHAVNIEEKRNDGFLRIIMCMLAFVREGNKRADPCNRRSASMQQCNVTVDFDRRKKGRKKRNKLRRGKGRPVRLSMGNVNEARVSRSTNVQANHVVCQLAPKVSTSQKEHSVEK